jgi:hypothetical protein
MDGEIQLNLERRMFSAIKRSATVIISNQINTYLSKYFSVTELLLLVFVMHTVFNAMRSVPGFGASWGALRDLTQLIFIRMLLSSVSDQWSPDLAFLNLVGLLLIAECVPPARGFVESDIVTFRTSVTYLFSDRVGSLFEEARIPWAGAALAIFLGGNHFGLLGQSLALTGVNTLCNAAFGAVISGLSLSLAWPISLLYFVKEVSHKYERANEFFDFGLYKASDVVYSGFARRGLDSLHMAATFGFLFALAPRDPIWGGICALVLVQASTDWCLRTISLVAESDPILAGLGVITVLHFLSLGIELHSSGVKKTPSKSDVAK